MSDSISQKLNAWCRLLRIPNFITVPGDPVAGFFLAGLAAPTTQLTGVIPAVIASLLLYAGGLISNDVLDLDEDRQDRPDRPLPSGKINPRLASLAAAVLMILGAAVSFAGGQQAGLTGCVLAAAILTYNRSAKSCPITGPLVMGLCRGLSLMLGAASAAPLALTSPAVPAALCLMLYIAAVTSIAARETEKIEIGVKRWLPAAGLIIGLTSLHALISKTGIDLEMVNRLSAFILAATAVAWAIRHAQSLDGTPEPGVVAGTIGKFIHGLLLVQASFCALTSIEGLIAAGILVAMMPALSALARKFHSS